MEADFCPLACFGLTVIVATTFEEPLDHQLIANPHNAVSPLLPGPGCFSRPFNCRTSGPEAHIQGVCAEVFPRSPPRPPFKANSLLPTEHSHPSHPSGPRSSHPRSDPLPQSEPQQQQPHPLLQKRRSISCRRSRRIPRWAARRSAAARGIRSARATLSGRGGMGSSAGFARGRDGRRCRGGRRSGGVR
jgi:hypothetical protein